MSFDLVVWMGMGSAGILFILLPFLPSGKKSIAAFISVALIALTTSFPAVLALTGSPLELLYEGGSVFGPIPLRLDALSAWFVVIINFTCLNGALYGIGYMKPYSVQKENTTLHWISFVIFHISMLAVCMLQNSLAFLIAWEIMSISSLLLVVFEHYKTDTVKAGINYLVQMHIGVLFLSLAFIWVYRTDHSFDFNGIASYLTQYPPGWLFLLFFIGFGLKAGFIPLHTWLPEAHPAAPSHISGVMSGVIVKLGIYGILRIVYYINTDLTTLGESLLILSVITSFYGILNAAVVRDFKRMLAFCTIENIGIIGMGIGIGMIGKGIHNPLLMLLGFTGALLHTLNHSLYKSLLFFSAGNLYQQTHTRNMEQLGGLIKKMPATALFFLCGSMAISGLPPFNGFISEFLIYTGLVEGIKSDNVQFSSMMMLCITGLAIVGGISIFTFSKTFGTIFLGSPRTEFHHSEEVSRMMRVPLFLILCVMLLIGIFPNLVFSPALAVSTCISGIRPDENMIGMTPIVAMIGRTSLLLMVLTAGIYFLRTRITQGHPSAYLPTWGCGYGVPNVRMQYTAKSFSKSFAKLFSFLVAEKKKYAEIEPNEVFPVSRTFQSNYLEFIDRNMITPVTNRLSAFMNFFTFIHNGRLQMYILYGFFFMVLLIMATFFNLL